uniref:Uncharacterized protein n=1 Tax=Rousettus aegyptiacus TaxID=9407 RepID=A0A7J8CJ57_ROUAE|nr:hypothetical protein HJG63_009239 [Rousettus aegyptiacus]
MEAHSTASCPKSPAVLLACCSPQPSVSPSKVMAEALGKDRIATRLTFLCSAHPGGESPPPTAPAIQMGRRFLEPSRPGCFSLNSLSSASFSLCTLHRGQQRRAGSTCGTWMGQPLGWVAECVISKFCGNIPELSPAAGCKSTSPAGTWPFSAGTGGLSTVPSMPRPLGARDTRISHGSLSGQPSKMQGSKRSNVKVPKKREHLERNQNKARGWAAVGRWYRKRGC